MDCLDHFTPTEVLKNHRERKNAGALREKI